MHESEGSLESPKETVKSLSHHVFIVFHGSDLQECFINGKHVKEVTENPNETENSLHCKDIM